MRSFYVYGFHRRDEYDQKSPRSYEDERRRVESWIGDYMSFRQDASGRQFFLSVDSRAVPHNPLYRAYRAKSFTDRDIMLHFHLMDILSVSGNICSCLRREEEVATHMATPLDKQVHSFLSVVFVILL